MRKLVAAEGCRVDAASAIANLQNLVRDLTPHAMDAMGLADVLPVQLEEWTETSGLEAQTRRRALPVPDRDVGLRIAKEAVSVTVLGGKLDVSWTPGRGTSVKATLAIYAEAAA